MANPKCEWCHQPFEPKQKYCSNSHRQQAYLRRKMSVDVKGWQRTVEALKQKKSK